MIFPLLARRTALSDGRVRVQPDTTTKNRRGIGYCDLGENLSSRTQPHTAADTIAAVRR